MKNVSRILVLVLCFILLASCALTFWGQAKAYAEKNRGQRPDEILDGVRDGRLVAGMNEKEANYCVWFSYQGKTSWDTFSDGQGTYRVKTMWKESGTGFIQLHFRDGALELWSRHH